MARANRSDRAEPASSSTSPDPRNQPNRNNAVHAAPRNLVCAVLLRLHGRRVRAGVRQCVPPNRPSLAAPTPRNIRLGGGRLGREERAGNARGAPAPRPRSSMNCLFRSMRNMRQNSYAFAPSCQTPGLQIFSRIFRELASSFQRSSACSAAITPDSTPMAPDSMWTVEAVRSGERLLWTKRGRFWPNSNSLTGPSRDLDFTYPLGHRALRMLSEA